MGTKRKKSVTTKTITKKELIELYAARHGIQLVQARGELERVTGFLGEMLTTHEPNKATRIALPDFGVFTQRTIAMRVVKGVGGTGEHIIPETWRVTFNPSANLRGVVKEVVTPPVTETTSETLPYATPADVLVNDFKRENGEVVKITPPAEAEQ